MAAAASRRLLALVAVVVVCACSSTTSETEPALAYVPVPITAAARTETGVRLVIEACAADVITSKTETNEQVKLKIARPAQSREAEPGCRTDLTIELQQPLGDRVLVNEATQEVVDVA